MPYVFSTITNDITYCDYIKGGADLPVLKSKILIKGGTGVATKHLVTALGISTKVTDEELAILKENDGFVRHMEKGFITFRDSNENPEKVASDMVTRDKSSPIVPQDYDPDSEGAKPIEEKLSNVTNKIAEKFIR